MLKVIAIDTLGKRVYETSVEGLDDMQALVGGLICPAATLDNGDEVYVNDEGLFNAEAFFDVGAHQPFAGNAYVIGPVDKKGNNTDVQSTVEQIKAKAEFLSCDQIRARYAPYRMRADL